MENIAEMALVTGAARRLGREIALGLARAGYAIGLHYHRSQAAAEQTAQEIKSWEYPLSSCKPIYWIPSRSIIFSRRSIRTEFP